MASIQRDLVKNNIILAEKIKIIYQTLCNNNIEELLELFIDFSEVEKNPNYLAHRKKSLRRILKNQTARESYFKKLFSKMKISKIVFDKGRLFDSDFFFNSSIDRFRLRIDEYLHYISISKIGIDLAYKHLYFFDYKIDKDRDFSIGYFKIDYIIKKSTICNNGLEVSIYDEDENSSSIYQGCIENDNQKIVIYAKNSHDNLIILFNASLVGSSFIKYFDKALYGIAVGIDDKNQKIPISKKVLLLQHKLTKEELKKLYLILNETDTIEARENLHGLELDIKYDISYLSKYNKKIASINSFFYTLKNCKEIETYLNDHLVFAEFYAFYKLFNKYSSGKEFFLESRKRILVELFRYIELNSIKEVVICLPIYDKAENIFLYDALERVSVRELLLLLAKKGVKFEIIFVVKRPQDYQERFMIGNFAMLENAGIDFSFVDYAQVERKVSSLDFIYSFKHKFAIIKDYQEYKDVFKITKENVNIRGCIKDFQTLKRYAYSYEEIVEESCTLALNDKRLLNLLGTWYGYFYGSAKDEQNRVELLEIKFSIYNDYSVESSREKCNSSGAVEISNHQTLFSMICKETQNSHYLVFDNSRVDDIFQVMLYSKENESKNDMANTGVLSREKLSYQLVRTLLGEPKNLMLVIKPNLQKRIKRYINQKATTLS